MIKKDRGPLSGGTESEVDVKRKSLQQQVESYLEYWENMDQWVQPDAGKSLMFVGTEYGEALDAYLRTEGNDGFVRNNQEKPDEDWREELGDVVFQAIVTLRGEDVDLEEMIMKKLERMNEKRVAAWVKNRR